MAKLAQLRREAAAQQSLRSLKSRCQLASLLTALGACAAVVVIALSAAFPIPPAILAATISSGTTAFGSAWQSWPSCAEEQLLRQNIYKIKQLAEATQVCILCIIVVN